MDGPMKPIVIALIASAIATFAADDGRADTIFDVEHARADYRAGLVSADDVELLNRWGRPSGYYPASRLFVSPQRRLLLKKRDWDARRW
jgi:hypothetical protein